MTRRPTTVALACGLSALLLGSGFEPVSGEGFRSANIPTGVATPAALPDSDERIDPLQLAESEGQTPSETGDDTPNNLLADRPVSDETRTSVRELRGRIIRSMRPVFMHRNLA